MRTGGPGAAGNWSRGAESVDRKHFSTALFMALGLGLGLGLILILAGCNAPISNRVDTSTPIPSSTRTSTSTITPVVSLTPSPTGTTAPTQTPSPTFTITPTFTSTPPLAFDPLELLHIPSPIFTLGPCPGAEVSQGPQAVAVASPGAPKQFRTLCLLGFPLDERIELSLVDPDGKVAHETAYRVLETYPPSLGSPATTVVRIPFDINLAYRPGAWTIHARSPSAEVSTGFEIKECQPASGPDRWPYTVTVRPSTRSPEHPLDPASFQPYKVGDQMEVRGACFPRDASVWLQFYRTRTDQPGRYELAWSAFVPTGVDGKFETTVTLPSGLLRDSGSGGEYFIVPVTEEISAALVGKVVNIATLPYTNFELMPIPGEGDCYRQARFRLGDRPQVSAGELPVFSSAGMSRRNLAAWLPPGRRVEVMNGPVCSGERITFMVHDHKTGIAGWVDQEGLQR